MYLLAKITPGIVPLQYLLPPLIMGLLEVGTWRLLGPPVIAVLAD